MTKNVKIIILLLVFNFIFITNVMATSIQNISTENNNVDNILLENTTIKNEIAENTILEDTALENNTLKNEIIDNVQNISEKINANSNLNNDIVEENVKQVIQEKSETNTKELKQINGIWRVIIGGMIDYNYTGLATNANGTYYLRNGELKFDYNGTIFENDTAYIIENSKVWITCIKNTTEVMQINKTWRMVKDGKVDYNYTGIGSNSNGTWYLENGMVTFKYTGIAKTNDGDYLVIGSKVKTDTTELMQINKEWRMVVNGKINYNYTGIGSNANGLYYVQNGTIKFDYKGTIYEGNTAYIIEKSKVWATCTKDTTEIIQINGTWRMVKDGEVDYNYTGIGSNKNGTYYVENGAIDFKYTGIYKAQDGNYIVEKNKVRTDYTKLMQINGTWRMVIAGKIDYNYTGITSNENGTYYVQNGGIKFDYTGTVYEGDTAYIIEKSRVWATCAKDTTEIIQINGTWRMVKAGKVDYNYTGVGSNANGSYYLENGIITFKYSGIYKTNDGDYVIEQSKIRTDYTKLMQIDGTWRMVIKGKIDYNYTGIGANENGKYYLQNGKITFDYKGTIYEGNTAYIIEKSKVWVTCTKSTTGLMQINGIWRMVINGKVDYNYTGVIYNENGGWLLQNGTINFNYNGEYTNVDGSVYGIAKGKVNEVIKNIQYPGTMWVDAPIKNNKYRAGTLNVSGWVLSTEKSETVQVLLDGKWVGVASRKERPDVFEVYNKGEYGGKASNLLPGFTLNINTSGLSKGNHTLEIINLTSNGVTIQSRKIEFAITDLTKSKGIDVSHYNGDINWNIVKNSGEVEFAILKIGEWHESKKQLIIDSHFETYYNECKRLGIAVGGYFYSYAFNSEEASREAVECLSVIRGKHFEMPIFLDVEDDILKKGVANGKTNRDELTNASITFCDILNNAGYRSGVYASKNFFRDYLNAPVLERYNIWLAHYTTSTDYTGKYDLWQWTSDGIVSGITGRVDLDWCFTRYY